MSDLVLTQDVYAQVIDAKSKNEAYINEVYNAYPSLSFDDKLRAMTIVESIKQMSEEYEKYIIIYQTQLKKEKTKTQYVVTEGDTLPRIAQKLTGNYSNWQQIYTHNLLKDTNLNPGDVLEIPEGL